MFCGRCGKYIPEGQVCPCEHGRQKKGSPLQTLLKILAVVFALLAIGFQFMGLTSEYRDFSIDEGDYEDYQDALMEEEEDYNDGKLSESFGYYGEDGAFSNDEGIPYLNLFALIAFALYIGTVVLSGKKNTDALRRIAQGVFFCLMLVVLVIYGYNVADTEEAYIALPEPRYESYSDDPNYSNYDFDIDLYSYYNDYDYQYSSYYEGVYLPIKEAGLTNEYDHSYYIESHALSVGWYLSVAACTFGLVVTAVAGVTDKKEEER